MYPQKASICSGTIPSRPLQSGSPSKSSQLCKYRFVTEKSFEYKLYVFCLKVQK